MAYADELQAVSVDEALIDVTSQVQALARAPPEFDVPTSAEGDSASAPHQTTDWAKVLAEKIRSDVRKATGCEGACQSTFRRQD